MKFLPFYIPKIEKRTAPYRSLRGVPPSPQDSQFIDTLACGVLACEQALLFGRVKRVSRKRASKRPSGPSLALSREARFACPNRRACSQASGVWLKSLTDLISCCSWKHIPAQAAQHFQPLTSRGPFGVAWIGQCLAKSRSIPQERHWISFSRGIY